MLVLPVYRTTSPRLYYSSTDEPTQYFKFTGVSAIQNRTITSDSVAGQKVLTVSFSDAVNFENTTSCLTFHFDFEPGDVSYDHTLYIPLGDYNFSSPAQLQQGDALLVKDSSKLVVWQGVPTISSHAIRIGIPEALIPTDPLLTVIRYLPNSIPLGRLLGGINSGPAYSTFHYFIPTHGSVTMQLPDIPEPESPDSTISPTFELVRTPKQEAEN